MSDIRGGPLDRPEAAPTAGAMRATVVEGLEARRLAIPEVMVFRADGR